MSKACQIPGFVRRRRTANSVSTMVFMGCLISCVAGTSLLACRRTPDQVGSAKQLIEKREYGPALEALARAVEADPGNPETQLEYARLLVRMRLWGRSVWPLYRAANAPGFSGADEALLLLAESSMRTGNQPDAIRAIDELIERNPDHFRARQLRARAYVRDHNEDPALEDIDWLLAHDETHESELDLLELKMKALLQLEKGDEAQGVLDTIRAQVDPDEDPARAARLCALNANFLAERDQLEQAEAGFEDCLERHPSSLIAVQKATAFFDSQGKTNRATRVLTEAVENTRDSIALRKALALRFRAIGQADDAVRVLEEGRMANPRETSILLAEHYMEIDDFPSALKAFERGFSVESDEELFEILPEEYRFMLGDILVLTHAEDRLQRLLPHIEEPAYRDFLKARMHQEKGELRQALEAFGRGFRIWPGSAGARFLAGWSASQLGDFDAAIDHYRAALRSDASLSNAGLELARLYAVSGNHTAAIGALVSHVKAHPTDAEALRMLADVYLVLDQKSQSANVRAVLEGLPGERDHAYADQARDLARYSTPRHALEFIGENIPDLLAPEFEETLAIWCEIMRTMGRTNEALAFLSTEAAHAREGHAYRDALRGQLLRSEGRDDEADAAFRRALAADPSEWRAALGEARLLAKQGRIRDAVRFFDRVASLNEKDPVALYESGILLAFGSQADPDEARQRLKEALKRQPTYGVAALALARIALAQGDISDEALGYARWAARIVRSVDSGLVAAKIELARGEAEPAIEAIEWAIESGAKGGDVHFLLATARLMMGDEEGAKADLKAALESGPFVGSEKAREQLSRLGGGIVDVPAGPG